MHFPLPITESPITSWQPSQELSWYALRTRSNQERIAAAILDSKGYEQFLPLYRSRHRRSDRVIETERPLFPGYLFCRFSPEHSLPILITPGVVYAVSFGREPAAISASEIESIRSVLKSGLRVGCCPFLSEGQRIRVIVGALEGLEGILLKYRNEWPMVVSITLLQRSIVVEIDRECVGPI